MKKTDATVTGWHWDPKSEMPGPFDNIFDVPIEISSVPASETAGQLMTSCGRWTLLRDAFILGEFTSHRAHRA
jgi:hypothetical protein